jgi:hypothetical protein
MYYNLPYVEPDRPLPVVQQGPGCYSFSGYSNPAMDACRKRGRVRLRDARQQIILDAQREMIKEHGPQINTYISHGVDCLQGLGMASMA